MRVQTYNLLPRFLVKTEDFLLKNEVQNNLFWEVLNTLTKNPSAIQWAANVFRNGKIQLSVIRTASDYLLLSSGTKSAVNQFNSYCKNKKLKIKGVSGPKSTSLYFSKKWLNDQMDLKMGRRDFYIFKSNYKLDKTHHNEENIFSLKTVGKNEWPKARLWALKFASGSTPEIDGSAIVNMARGMMQREELFFLQKKGLGSCAMAGFGRQTKNFKVINLVFVPEEHRQKGIARRIVFEVLKRAKVHNQSNALLFSDYRGKRNLYEAAGLEMETEYCERMFY